MEQADAPPGLRSTKVLVGAEVFVVLSYPTPKQASCLGNLTGAETAVVRAASAGLSSAEIAAHRGSSVFTVNNQLNSAYRKLGVSSRWELQVLLNGLDGHAKT